MTTDDLKETSEASRTSACAIDETQLTSQLGERSEVNYPPEGGWRWSVCLGVSIVNFLTVGQQNAAGVVYDAIMNEFSTPRGETGILFGSVALLSLARFPSTSY